MSRSLATAICAIVLLLLATGCAANRVTDLRRGPGDSLVFTATTADGQPVDEQQLKAAEAVLHDRLDRLGYAYRLGHSGSDTMTVTLWKANDLPRIATILSAPGVLVFFDDAECRVSGPAQSAAAAVDQAQKKPLVDVPRTDRDRLVQLTEGPGLDGYLLVRAVPGVPSADDTSDAFFVYKDQPVMTGEAVGSARKGLDSVGTPDVKIDFTTEGAAQFESVTRDLATRGALKNVPQTFAIVLDGVMWSDPQIDYQANPNGIAGGKAVITGRFSEQDATMLAVVLDSGALPVHLELKDPAPSN